MTRVLLTVRIGDTVTAIHCASQAAQWLQLMASSMSRSHGDNLTGKRHYSKDPISDNAPDQSAWVGCHPDHSSWVGCRPKEWSATYHGNYSGYHNSGSTTSYVPDACTGSDSDRAAPIAKYLANGEDAEVPAQCTNGGVTTAAPFTGSKKTIA